MTTKLETAALSRLNSGLFQHGRGAVWLLAARGRAANLKAHGPIERI